ncbi:hypothetical protein VTL71DRAFT_4795 [Oculimacula yallundae]|uniref:Endosomal spry domain-containing protein n=1 Tax=Oculimacula yallundae TaxID=86028 RepID=A0ABR4C2Z5_9HELO
MAPLPALKTYLTTLLTRSASPSPSPLTNHLNTLLYKRADRHGLPDPGSGVTEPDQVPNKTVFILIGLIGAGFVITGIWFFFWAKNGGFYFQENDWDDYKSTVLRRKGPNGTTLSGATESTDLGGGSVVHGEKSGRSLWGGRKGRKNKGKNGVDRYKDFDEESSALGTESYGGSTLGSEMGYAAAKSKKSAKPTKPKKTKKSKGAPSEAGTLDTELDVEADVADAMRAYRHEKPARVGGLNKQPDGSSWDGSNTHDGMSAASDLLSHRERTPTSTPTKGKKERKDAYTGGSGAKGIRKVVSTSEGASGPATFWGKGMGNGSVVTSASDERIKAEAKKLQEKGRAAQRRDFSFQIGDDGGNGSVVSEATSASDRTARREERERRRKSRSPTKKVPGSYVADQESLMGSEPSEVGTKSYHHPIPGLSSAGSAVGSDYTEERRRKRNAASSSGGGGYRRGRRDSLSD